MASAPLAIWKRCCSNLIATPPVWAKAQTEKEKKMNIGQKMLTFTAMAALNVGSLLGHGFQTRQALEPSHDFEHDAGTAHVAIKQEAGGQERA
jgi:hypothetical protein